MGWQCTVMELLLTGLWDKGWWCDVRSSQLVGMHHLWAWRREQVFFFMLMRAPPHMARPHPAWFLDWFFGLIFFCFLAKMGKTPFFPGWELVWPLGCWVILSSFQPFNVTTFRCLMDVFEDWLGLIAVPQKKMTKMFKCKLEDFCVDLLTDGGWVNFCITKDDIGRTKSNGSILKGQVKYLSVDLCFGKAG